MLMRTDETVALLAEILKPIRDPLAEDDGRPLEVLNALAAAVAVVLRGTNADPRYVEFFQKSLVLNLQVQEEPHAKH